MSEYYTCSPQFPCNRPKKCGYCAKTRQMRIANTAESRNQADYLTWACLSEYDDKSKTRLLRALDTRGGMWTIEQGRMCGKIHLNVLAEGVHNAATIAAAYRLKGVEAWTKRVPRADIRNVAAYISKRDQYPDDDFKGRTYGSFGAWRGTVAEALTSKDMIQQAPTIAAQAIENEQRRQAAPMTAEVKRRLAELKREFEEEARTTELSAAEAALVRFPHLMSLDPRFKL